MIKIYTVPNCERCKEVKKYMTNNNIEFEELDLKHKENREARAFYRSLGVKTAPVIIGNDKKGKEWILTEYDKDIFIELMES